MYCSNVGFNVYTNLSNNTAIWDTQIQILFVRYCQKLSNNFNASSRKCKGEKNEMKCSTCTVFL